MRAFLEAPARALRERIEGAERGDRLAFQLDAHRLLVAEREDVHDPAAMAHLARLADHDRGLVAEVREPEEEWIEIERLADAQGDDRVHRAARAKEGASRPLRRTRR